MKPIRFLILVAVVALFAACATVTPNELISARAAYETAAAGPAAQLVPADLHKAQVALELAERSFQENSDSYITRDLAYVAQRKAELAEALAVAAADKIKKAEAEAALQREQAAVVVRTRQDLADSEARTAAALAELARLAAVKQEARGLVITLSGSVLFESAQWTLLPSAQVKLDQVAKALLAVGNRDLIIEGHTDSQGSDQYNQVLSQHRADAVRDYLVQRGYPANRIQARGMGEGHPIADNRSPEGRANNRRVEIIIAPETHPSN